MPTKSPSSGIHKPTWKPSSITTDQKKYNLRKMIDLPSSPSIKEIDLYQENHSYPDHLSSHGNIPPSKSPSSGLHKPTWKPTEAYHEGRIRSLKGKAYTYNTIAQNSIPPSKNPSSGTNKLTWKPSTKSIESNNKAMLLIESNKNEKSELSVGMLIDTIEDVLIVNTTDT